MLLFLVRCVQNKFFKCFPESTLFFTDLFFPSVATIYLVRVFTGDLKGSGTNSNVFVNIHGENGDTGDRQLKKSETHIDKFERNQVRTEHVFRHLILDFVCRLVLCILVKNFLSLRRSIFYLSSFHTFGLFLYPLKTLETLWFS